MTRLLTAVLACFLSFSGAHAMDIRAVSIPDIGTYWLVEDHTYPMIAVRVAVREAGSAYDPDGKAGLAALTAGLLNEGAGDMNAEAYQGRLEDLAIDLGFSTDRDNLIVSLRTLSEHRAEAFRLMGLALSAPRFDPDAVERVRHQMLSLVAQEEESPSSSAALRWYARAFAGHPYSSPQNGTRESLKAITRKDLQTFAANHYARNALVISVVGDVTEEEATILIKSAFNALPFAAASVPVAKVAPTPPAGIEIIERPIPQSTVIFGHAGISRNDPDWFAAQVMNYILGGGGFASRLVNEVREKRGLAYSVSSSFNDLAAADLFVGSVGTKNERVKESIELIRLEMEKLKAEGATEEEVVAAKKYLTGSYPLAFASNAQIAGQLLVLQLKGYGPEFVAQRNSYIEAVTLEDVNRVAARLLRPDQVYWVVVGAPDGLESTVPVAE
jgi:zinc protease